MRVDPATRPLNRLHRLTLRFVLAADRRTARRYILHNDAAENVT